MAGAFHFGTRHRSAGAWFELSVNRQINLDSLRKLKPVFAAKLSERDKLIDETLESATSRRNSRPFPISSRRFRSPGRVPQAQLTQEQDQAFTGWLEKQQQAGGGRGGMFFGNPGAMVK